MLSKILMLILAASILASIAYWPITAEAQLPLPPGIPRGDVLVIENHYGTHADPENFNYLVPGRPGFGASGFSQVCAGFLWYINTTNSELISWLAAGPLVPRWLLIVIDIHLLWIVLLLDPQGF
jgi:hypothetical protein